MNKPTPRINSKLREKYAGRTVRIIGKVTSYSGETAVLETTDHGQILIKLNGEGRWGSDYVEVIGKLESDYSVSEFSTSNLGNNIGKVIK
ncbi:replication factor A protein 3 [Dichotomocladium elegans]|nr:replication factor A protein 3 [Dichotomocladium elegans]